MTTTKKYVTPSWFAALYVQDNTNFEPAIEFIHPASSISLCFTMAQLMKSETKVQHRIREGTYTA